MKYILIKDLPPVFVPGADKEVFVKDGKVYINAMFNGLIGTLEDCLASGFVKEIKGKKKITIWAVWGKNTVSGFYEPTSSHYDCKGIPLGLGLNKNDIGVFPTEIEVEE